MSDLFLRNRERAKEKREDRRDTCEAALSGIERPEEWVSEVRDLISMCRAIQLTGTAKVWDEILACISNAEKGDG